LNTSQQGKGPFKATPRIGNDLCPAAQFIEKIGAIFSSLGCAQSI